MRTSARLIALILLTALPSFAAAQTAPPAQKAKYLPPVKGVATIEVVQMPSKRVGKEMVTVVKVRNTSAAPINLLKADEYWYDKTMKIVSGDQYAHKKAPIQPGEIVEITLRSPIPQGTALYRNHVLFRHAYGEAKATAVKAFK
jgi:uncharacterized protein YcfL